MGKFILIDFKKREDKKTIANLVPEKAKNYYSFIKNYSPEGLPPNEEECAAIEEEQISLTLSEFDEVAGHLWRVKDEVPNRRHRLVSILESRRGKLWARFSESVSELQDLADLTMEYCVARLEETEEDVKGSLPEASDSIVSAFDKLVEDCEEYIEETFPGGVEGLTAFDDNLDAFKESIEGKKNEEYPAANADAINDELEKLKEESMIMVKKWINDVVKTAVYEIEKDISDDTLPYLDEEKMWEFRDVLITAAKEYAESRLDGDVIDDEVDTTNDVNDGNE